MNIEQGKIPEEAKDELQRRGDVTKCPICGSQVDAEAYFCATCQNYFCFHCRARVLESELQLQCVNQDCDYYGKLICSACEDHHEKDEPPSLYLEPEDGYWPAWLLVVLVVGAVIWYFTSFWWGAGMAIVLYAGGGYGMQRAGLNLFGKTRQVEYQRKSEVHTCISCEEPVKVLRERAT